MNYEVQTGPFYKSLMAGLFGGIIITIANLMYNFVYRGVTKFNPSELINVTSIIFVSLILSMIAGVLYYLIVPYAKKSKAIYMVLFVILTIVVTYSAFGIHRSDDPTVTSQFHGLLAGIIIITGLTDCILIPYMVKHRNIAF